MVARINFEHKPGRVIFSFDEVTQKRIAVFACACGGTRCLGGFVVDWPMNYPDISGCEMSSAVETTVKFCRQNNINTLKYNVSGMIALLLKTRPSLGQIHPHELARELERLYQNKQLPISELINQPPEADFALMQSVDEVMEYISDLIRSLIDEAVYPGTDYIQ